MTVVATSNKIPMFGIVGRSVKLPCNIPVADRPIVEWSDTVWTSDANPLLIFRSESNPDFEIHAFHQNRNSYVIDNDFALIIDGLDMDADPGQYTCQSVVDGIIHERDYYLTVGELPACPGNVALSEGQSANLTCEMTFSGQQPLLQWFRGVELVQSHDEYDIRLAKKVVTLEMATHNDNQAEYTCRMSLGDTIKECSHILNVTYSVRDIKFLPEREKFRVGDELKCSAKGNPVPSITLLPEDVQGKAGPGWHSLVIGQNWEGQRLMVQCTARNSISSKTATLSSNLSVFVTEPKKQTTASLPNEGHPNVHSMRHMTPPIIMKKEGENTWPAVDAKERQTEDFSPERQTEDSSPERQTEDSSPEVTGARPVKTRSNEADHVKHLGYFTVLIIVLLVHLVLPVFFLC